MRSKWRTATIGDLVTLQRGFDLPSQDRKAGSIPVMGSAGISGYHDKASTGGPGVVIGRSGVGSMGVTSFIDRDFWALNTTLFVSDFKGNDVGFIYYLLKSIDFRHLDSGSAQASLNRNVVYPIKVAVPASAGEQRAISLFLSGIDQRIALLRQSNAVRESIAHSLFQSWFINFEPVRAKHEGREPAGIDPSTSSLFPAEFDESAERPIPKGWKIGTLAELSLLNESSWSARRAPSEVLYVDLAGLKSNVFEPPQRFPFADAPSRARRELRAGDTLVGTVRPGNRSFGFIAEGQEGLTGSTGFAVLTPKSPDCSAFIYLCATREDNIERLAALADGGAYPAVRPELVHATSCAIPPPSVLKAFEALVSPLLMSISVKTMSARTLTDLRDTLLRPLITGKLRLPECEEELRESIA